MQTFRRIAIGLFGFLCVAAISLTVYLATLQLTLLNREVAKSWVSESGVYKNNLIPELIQAGAEKAPKPDPSLPTASFEIPPSALKLALQKTFTQEFTREQTETVIDNFYDWTEGKAPAFTYSIPINEKRDVFIDELARASEPAVATLPICNPNLAIGTLCRPANISAEVYSRTIITDNINKSNLFNEPITSSDNADGALNPVMPFGVTTLTPMVKPLIGVFIALALISLGMVLWLTTPPKRLSALSSLGKRVFFGQIFGLIAALALIWAFHANYIKIPALFAGQPPIITDTLSNLLKIAFISVAGQLAILSGIICAVSIIIWLGIKYWQRTHTTVPISEPPAEQPPVI